MTKTNLSMSISADGYVAGPGQSEENPLGFGGRKLHAWHVGPTKDHPVNRQGVSDMMDGMGATIMGRNMFGPVRGEWVHLYTSAGRLLGPGGPRGCRGVAARRPARDGASDRGR